MCQPVSELGLIPVHGLQFKPQSLILLLQDVQIEATQSSWA